MIVFGCDLGLTCFSVPGSYIKQHFIIRGDRSQKEHLRIPEMRLMTDFVGEGHIIM